MLESASTNYKYVNSKAALHIAPRTEYFIENKMQENFETTFVTLFGNLDLHDSKPISVLAISL